MTGTPRCAVYVPPVADFVSLVSSSFAGGLRHSYRSRRAGRGGTRGDGTWRRKSVSATSNTTASFQVWSRRSADARFHVAKATAAVGSGPDIITV